MRRWVGLTLFAVVLLGGAFGVSALAIEWRQDTTDLSPIETAVRETGDEVADLKSDIADLQGQLSRISAEQPPLTPTPEVTPTPTVSPVALIPDSAELDGARVTVDKISTGRVEFILEGPHSGALAQNFKVVDEDGFVCEAGIDADSGSPLAEGERTRFWINYTCAEGRAAKTLSLDGITFEFSER